MSERRRDYMVSKRVHTLYMLTWITSVLLVASFAALVYSLVQTSEVHTAIRPLAGAINPFLLMGILAFVIVCASLFNGVYTILHTHRMVGSAYRIGVVLREINEDKPTRVKLREGDFFTEIGDEINRLADRVQATPGQSEPSAPAPAAEGARAPERAGAADEGAGAADEGAGAGAADEGGADGPSASDGATASGGAGEPSEAEAGDAKPEAQ